MKNLVLLLAFTLSFLSFSHAQQTRHFTQSIYFDTDVHTLDAAAQSSLDGLVKTLQESPDFDLSIEAYCDERGTVAYNEALAQRRAQSAADYLLRSDIRPRSTTVKSYGEREQRSADNAEDQLRINRRVDILVTAYYFDNLSDLMQRIDPSRSDEVFRFENNGERQTFTSARGTKVAVPANAFQFEDGTLPTGTIEFRLREAYDASAWFLNKLSTETIDGQLLQTGGMVFTEATSEGKNLKVREGEKLTVAVPLTAPRKDDMQLFYGEGHEENSESFQSGMAWRAVPASMMRDRVTPFDEAKKIDIEPSIAEQLAQIQYDVPMLIEKPKFSELHFPKPPYLPNEPRFTTKKPEREDFKFHPNTIWERLYSKEKKRAIEEKQFAKKTEEYTKRKTYYEKRKQEYDEAVANKKEDLEQYEKELGAWRTEAERRIKLYYDYTQNDYFQRGIPALNAVLSKGETLKIPCTGNSHALLHAIANKADYMAAMIQKNREIQVVNFKGTTIPIGELGIVLPKNDELSNKFRFELFMAKSRALGGDFRKTYLVDLLKDDPRIIELSKASKDASMQECIAQGDERALNAYVFDVTQMGWCNVDRLMQLKPQEIMAFEVEETEEAVMNVLIPDINAAVQMTALKNGRYRSNLNLPKGQRAILVALKVENGKAQLAKHEFVVGESEMPALVYQTMAVSEVRKALEGING